MAPSKNLSRSFVLSALLATTCMAAEDLGIIGIDSTTIDDRFTTKQTEVSSTSTISGETVDDSHVENIQQVLNSIPGITTEVKTGDSIKIHIRGVENQMYMGEKPGVAVVIDGVPVFERTGSVNIDLDNIESIKVVKGGASYLFGDDALSGAVIITTKKGAKYNHNFAAVERGSFGYQKLLARTGYANDDLSFHIQASERKSDGYHEDSDYSAKYLDGKLQYYLDSTSDLTFGAEYSQRKKDSHGTVGGIIEAESNPESIYLGDQKSRDYTRKYDVELLKLFLTYSKDFSNNSNLLVNGYIYMDDTYYWSNPQTKDGDNVTQLSYTDDDYVYDNFYEQIQRGVKSEYRTASSSFATLLGLDLRANEYKNKVVYRTDQALVSYYPTYTVISDYFYTGYEKSNDQTDENVYAVYGEYKQGITDGWSATANLRYDAIKLDYTDSSYTSLKKDFNIYSYRIGTNYDFSDDVHLFANYSTGFRAPTITQLFAGDVSAWGYTENNPDLKPEKSHNYELGLRGKLGNINYEGSLFQIDRKDFIMKTSGNYGASSSISTDMWDNVGGARHRGLELAVNAQPFETFTYSIAYTYLDAKYTDYKNFAIDLDGNPYTTVLSYFDVTGNIIPRTSKHNLNIMLGYTPTPKWNFTAEWNKKSSYYADDLNQLKIDGQDSFNLLGEYRTKLDDYAMTFFARVDNLLDNQYYNTARASSDRDGDGLFTAEDLSITVNQGRTITAGLSVKF